jgi:hypothetical protein
MTLERSSRVSRFGTPDDAATKLCEGTAARKWLDPRARSGVVVAKYAHTTRTSSARARATPVGAPSFRRCRLSNSLERRAARRGAGAVRCAQTHALCAATTANSATRRAQTSIESQTQAEPKCDAAHHAPSAGASVAGLCAFPRSQVDARTAARTWVGLTQALWTTSRALNG